MGIPQNTGPILLTTAGSPKTRKVRDRLSQLSGAQGDVLTKGHEGPGMERGHEDISEAQFPPHAPSMGQVHHHGVRWEPGGTWGPPPTLFAMFL